MHFEKECYLLNLEKIQPFGRQLTAFDVTLDMLLKDNQANVLTNSQVVTLNGHAATIDMVDGSISSSK